MGARKSLGRRWRVATAAAMAAAVLAGGVPAFAQATHDGMDHEQTGPTVPPPGEPGHGHDATGILPHGDWTDEQVTYAVHLVEQATIDLQAYADVTALPAMGFHNFGVTAPGGWDHWINNSRMQDGHFLDPKFPESLVFRRTAAGQWQLEAAMFYAEGLGMEAIPPELAWLPGWHTHPELCIDEGGRFTGIANNGVCGRGQVGPPRPMTHVWIVDNSCGHRFAGIGVGGIDCTEHHEPPGAEPLPLPGPPPPKAPPGKAPTPVSAKPNYTG